MPFGYQTFGGVKLSQRTTANTKCNRGFKQIFIGVATVPVGVLRMAK